MMEKYNVSVRSKTGSYLQYNGSVQVSAYDEMDAIDKAFTKVANMINLNRSLLDIEKVQCLSI